MFALIFSGSGWVLLNFVSMDINLIRYNPLRASSFIKLLNKIHNKMACINVENIEDNKCFLWSILAHDHHYKDETRIVNGVEVTKKIPRFHDPQRPQNYTEFEDELNMKGINYPVAIPQIPLFERLNNRSVNVYALVWNREERMHEVVPIFITASKQDTHTNLLMVQDKHGCHYVWIKNMSALVRHQITRHTGGTLHLCDRCLKNCTSEETLAEHEKHCSQHRAQLTEFAKPGSKLKFSKIKHQHPVDFFFVADMETYIEPIQGCAAPSDRPSTTKVNTHKPLSASYYLVSAHDKRMMTKPRVFEGETLIEDFIDALQEDGKRLTKILDVNVPYGVPEAERLELITAATECHICNGPPAEEDPFVLDHNHLDGSVRGVAHNSCNLNYRPNKCVHNVFMHNSKMFDTHLILSYVDTARHGEITVIPKTTEQYVSFRLGNLVFKDSFQFMNKKLDELVESLDPKTELPSTTAFLKDYVKNITENPELLESRTLGLFQMEKAGETFTRAPVRKKKSKKKSNNNTDISADESIPPPSNTPVLPENVTSTSTSSSSSTTGKSSWMLQ